MKRIVFLCLFLLFAGCGSMKKDGDVTVVDVRPYVNPSVYTDLGIGIDNRTGHEIDLDMIDCIFLQIEEGLGFACTPVDLVILIEPDLFPCPPNVLGKQWCGGAFYPGDQYKPYLIQVVWDMNPLTVEMNRYFLHWYGEPDWNCEYLECMDGYIKWGEITCE